MKNACKIVCFVVKLGKSQIEFNVEDLCAKYIVKEENFMKQEENPSLTCVNIMRIKC